MIVLIFVTKNGVYNVPEISDWLLGYYRGRGGGGGGGRDSSSGSAEWRDRVGWGGMGEVGRGSLFRLGVEPGLDAVQGVSRYCAVW